MNVFNRIFLVIVLLALATLAISVIVLAWTIPADAVDALRDAVNWLEDHNQDLEKALLTAAGSLIALLALIIVLFELLPQSGPEVKVTDLKVGDAYLSTAAIGQRVEEAVSGVPHVAGVKATVRSKRKGVQVSLDLHVDPEANLATVTDAACEAARDVLINRVHVALVEPPRARLHYRELRLRRAVAAGSASPAGATPPPESELDAERRDGETMERTSLSGEPLSREPQADEAESRPEGAAEAARRRNE